MAEHKINQPEEIWKPVCGFGGRYEVSSLGRVRSLDSLVHFYRNGSQVTRRSPGRIIRQQLSSNGYYWSLGLSDMGTVRHSVHVLVCAAFHGPRPEGYQAAHSNGDPHDNRPENLRWASPSENQADKILHGTDSRGEKHGNSKLTAEDVLRIRARRADGEKMSSIRLSYPHIGRSCIGKIIRGGTWGWLK